MPELYGRFKEQWRHLPPVSAGERIVAAVSGGPDSVCLLDLLRRHSLENGMVLSAAYLHHGLRAEADGEARFVADLAGQWDLPFHFDRVEIGRLAREWKLSKQAAARKARFAFLQRIADDWGARWIALGHTADDQAETVLIRLLRGSGPSGLSGIPPVREGRILRPILAFSRQEILEHLRARDLPFMEDASNAENRYLRNRIRHELLPILKRYNPRIREILCREANLLAEEDRFLEEEVKARLPLLFSRKAEGCTLHRGELTALHPVLARRVIRWALRETRGNLEGIGSIHLEQILRLATGPVSRRRHLPGGIVVEREYDRIRFRSESPRPSGWEPVTLSVPGEGPLPFGSGTLRLELIEGTIGSPPPLDATVFDFDRLTPPLILRPRRPGDRFYPIGTTGSKKLQDYFVDRKIPRRDRDQIALMSSEEGILWIVGHAQDRRFVPTATTRRTLLVTRTPDPPHERTVAPSTGSGLI